MGGPCKFTLSPQKISLTPNLLCDTQDQTAIVGWFSAQLNKGAHMKHVLGVFTLVLLLATALFGQMSGLTGTVVDPTGAVVPRTTIEITGTQTAAQRSTVSDTQGH